MKMMSDVMVKTVMMPINGYSRYFSGELIQVRFGSTQARLVEVFGQLSKVRSTTGNINFCSRLGQTRVHSGQLSRVKTRFRRLSLVREFQFKCQLGSNRSTGFGSGVRVNSGSTQSRWSNLVNGSQSRPGYFSKIWHGWNWRTHGNLST
uniref:Uncharacterized protein n=1 Tax=Helianthus annuus TaxID=4232 RepID=A0A251U599_HELAN